jgi:hypothetical protein
MQNLEEEDFSAEEVNDITKVEQLSEQLVSNFKKLMRTTQPKVSEGDDDIVIMTTTLEKSDGTVVTDKIITSDYGSTDPDNALGHMGVVGVTQETNTTVSIMDEGLIFLTKTQIQAMEDDVDKNSRIGDTDLEIKLAAFIDDETRTNGR